MRAHRRKLPATFLQLNYTVYTCEHSCSDANLQTLAHVLNTLSRAVDISFLYFSLSKQCQKLWGNGLSSSPGTATRIATIVDTIVVHLSRDIGVLFIRQYTGPFQIKFLPKLHYQMQYVCMLIAIDIITRVYMCIAACYAVLPKRPGLREL